MGWGDDIYWDGDLEQRLVNERTEPRVSKVCKYGESK